MDARNGGDAVTQERCDTPCDSAQIEPKPAPGAYLLESTKQNAEYWERGARDLAKEGKTIEEVMQCYMQAMFAYRNAAYGLAEKLHFAGYDPKTGTVASETTLREPPVAWAVVTSDGDPREANSIHWPATCRHSHDGDAEASAKAWAKQFGYTAVPLYAAPQGSASLRAAFKANLAASADDLKEKLKPYEDGERASNGR
jgi:hypothetical protein